MGVGSCSVRILPESIGGGTNDETNNVLDSFCGGSYGARRFPPDSEKMDGPLGPGRLGKPAREQGQVLSDGVLVLRAIVPPAHPFSRSVHAELWSPLLGYLDIARIPCEVVWWQDRRKSFGFHRGEAQ